MTSLELNRNIDRIAAAMAANAGQVWERLENHPGYLRNRFRQEAQRLIAGFGAPEHA